MSGGILLCCEAESKAPPYLDALLEVGFAAGDLRLAVAPDTEADEGARLAARADGIVLCGGADIDPRHYGEEPHPDAKLDIEPERDRLEAAVLRVAREHAVPVFGVCRGLQVINVFLGGTLWQDLKLQWPGSLLHDLAFPRDALIHPVTPTVTGHPLAEVLEREVTMVNSRHHQAIKTLAGSLKAIARAPDGIVEAVAGRHPGWWLWAVQWHPENLAPLSVQRALWEGFRDAARNGRPVARSLVR